MPVLALICLCSLQACTSYECPQTLPTIPLTVNSKLLSVEIAATPGARQCGLSRRNHLEADHGMLFIYDHEQKPYFWMKDTAIPLSIIFIDSNYFILEHHDMIPHSTKVTSSNKFVRYALEVNQSWFENNAIRPGDKVMFTLPQNIEVR